jgi:TLD
METMLIYKGSQHGFRVKDFHDRADKRGPTITLFKMDTGDVVGGFTQA